MSVFGECFGVGLVVVVDEFVGLVVEGFIVVVDGCVVDVVVVFVVVRIYVGFVDECEF